MALTTIEAQGPALRITTACPLLADHHWQQRRRLLQLAGVQRLLLTIALPGAEPLQLAWEPPPLPAALPASRRRRRRR